MTRAEAEPLWEKARHDADAIMGRLEADGQVEFDPDIPEHEMARVCLRELLVLALSPLRNEQLKISALRTLLAHTKPKPVVRSEINLQQDADVSAWLEKVIEDHRATAHEAESYTAS